MADTNATYYRTVTADMPDCPHAEISFTLTTVPGIVGTEVFPGKTWELVLDVNGAGSIKLPTPDNTGTLAYNYNIGTPDGEYYRDRALSYDAVSLTLAAWLATAASSATVDAVLALIDTTLPRHADLDSQTLPYTLVSADNGKVIAISGTGTLTLPDGLADGFQCALIHTDTNTATIAASTTLYSPDGETTITTQYAQASALHWGSGVWYLEGRLG